MKCSSRLVFMIMFLAGIIFPQTLFSQNLPISNEIEALKHTKVNVPFSTSVLDSQYHTYEELGAELDSLSKLYPGLAHLDTIGYTQQFKRCIWAMKISKNAGIEEDEPIVLFIGEIHANEVFGVEMCCMLINELLNSYGKDQNITRLLDSTAVWLIPMMNPDGHHAITNGICSFWRKNGRDDNNNGVFYEYGYNPNHEGVDLNRNFGYRWPGPENNIWSSTYCGERPFSESETRAIRDFATMHSVQLSVSIHSWSEVVMYPYWIGTIPWIGTWIPTKDDSVVADIASNMAGRMKTMKDTTQNYFSDNSMTDGFMDSWFYKEFGTYQFLIEMLPNPLFVIPGDQLKKVYNETKGGFIYLMERAHGPGLTGHITDKLTGSPLYAEVRILQAYEPLAGPRMTDPIYGRYFHYLKPGKYDVRIVKNEYQSQDFTNVLVQDGRTTVLDAALQKTPLSVPSSGTAAKYSLEQNYPNPFNPNTTIKYSLLKQSYVELKIFDMLGREISTLVSKEQSAGEYKIQFNASSLLSGIYIYTIQSGQFRDTKKLVLLR